MKLTCSVCHDKINPNERYVGFKRPTGVKIICLRCYKQGGGNPAKIRTRVDGGLGRFKHGSIPTPRPRPMGRAQRRFMENSNGEREEGYAEHEDPLIEEEEEYEAEEPERLPMRSEQAKELMKGVHEQISEEEEKQFQKLLAEGLIEPEVEEVEEAEEPEEEPEGGWPTIEKVEEEIYGQVEPLSPEVPSLEIKTEGRKFVKAEGEGAEFIGLPEYKKRYKQLEKTWGEVQERWDEYQESHREDRKVSIPEELWQKAYDDPENIGEGWFLIGKKYDEFEAHEVAMQFELEGYKTGVRPVKRTRFDVTVGTGPRKRGALWGIFIYDPQRKKSGVEYGKIVYDPIKKGMRPMEMNPKKGKKTRRSTEIEEFKIGVSKLGGLSFGMLYKVRDLMRKVIPEIKRAEIQCRSCNKAGKEKEEDPKVGIDPLTLKRDPKTGEIYINEKTGLAMGKVCPECKGEGFYMEDILPDIFSSYGPHLLQPGTEGIEMWGPRKGEGVEEGTVYLNHIILYPTLSTIEQRIKDLEEYNEFNREKKPVVMRRLYHSFIQSEEPLHRYYPAQAEYLDVLDVLGKFNCKVCNLGNKQKKDDPKIGIDPISLTADPVTGKVDKKDCPACKGEGFYFEAIPEEQVTKFEGKIWKVGYYKTTVEPGKPYLPVIYIGERVIARGKPQANIMSVVKWIVEEQHMPMTIKLQVAYDKARARVLRPPVKGETRERMLGYFYHSSKPATYSPQEFWVSEGNKILSDILIYDDEEIEKYVSGEWNDLPEELRIKLEQKGSLSKEIVTHFPKESDEKYWKKHSRGILKDLLNLDDVKVEKYIKMEYRDLPKDIKESIKYNEAEMMVRFPLEAYGYPAWWSTITGDSRVNHLYSVMGFTKEEIKELEVIPFDNLPDDIKAIALEEYNAHPKEVYYNFYIESFMGRITINCEVRHPIHGSVIYHTPGDIRYIDQALQLFEKDIFDEYGDVNLNGKVEKTYPGAGQEAVNALQTLEKEMESKLAELAEKKGIDPNDKEQINDMLRHPKKYDLPSAITAFLVGRAIKVGRPGGLDWWVYEMLSQKKTTIRGERKVKTPKDPKKPKEPRKPGERRTPGPRARTHISVETIPLTFEVGDLPEFQSPPSTPETPQKPTGTEGNPIGETIITGLLAGLASGATAGLISSAVTSPKSNPKKKRKGPAKGSPEAKAKMARIRAMRKTKNNNGVM